MTYAILYASAISALPSMNYGIVGNEEAKFVVLTRMAAKGIIREILADPKSVMVSGHCHLGGIDIWAEEVADELKLPKIIHAPVNRRWRPHGFEERNLLIVRDSHQVHNIVVSEYPPDYHGIKFDSCYHCNSSDHVKSGGCWTAKKAALKGKPAFIYIIHPSGATEKHDLLH